MTEQTQPLVSGYPAAFVRAVGRLLDNEGGYSDDTRDRGEETKYGISKREYPELDIKSLTREQAVGIYYRDWWTRYGYSKLPGAVGAKLFDLAVNIGPGHATRCLQRALRACGRKIGEDGVLGEQTVGAVVAANQLALIAGLRAEAAGYYRLLAAEQHDKANADFLSGWLNRAYE